MRAVVIHNPSSGASSHASPLQAALTQLRALGWEIVARETQAGGDATRLARQAADENFDAAFAVGGDGTVNEVLNGLLDSPTALAVLPLGTANVWALEMGLPLNDMARAATLQAHAPVRAVDIGIARGGNKDDAFGPRAFLLFCGAGFDASVIREVEAQRVLKRQWGKLFFILVGLRQALQYRGRRVTVTVDGKTYKRRVILALASNAQLYGALVRMPPDARIDDGILDVTLLHGDNALHTAWHFIRLGMGFYKQQPDIEHLRGRAIEIRGATLPVHVDAEPVGATPLQIQIKPRAVRVFVPETANRKLFETGD
ncbi:MAG: diacylglycerol kinase family lipid kinase [Chloroflexi bacterium]|nr:diacylglycerol kinase family lipid kinase [Chloroflexota bacterium]